MIFKSFTGGPFQTNSYIVADDTTKEACLVDCPHETFDQVAHFIEKHNLNLTFVVLTHSHFDHIGDLSKIKEKFSPSILVHKLDRKNVEQPGSDGLPLFIDTPPTEVDREIKEGDVISIGSVEMKVLETPGHCPGSICLYIEKDKILFDGDVIFKQGRGRTDLPGCDEKVLYESIKKILALGDDVVLYSGHGPKTTIGEERSLYD